MARLSPILLLAGTGCAGIAGEKAVVLPDWTASSNAFFLSSTSPQDIVYQAKFTITAQGLVFCTAARFSLNKIEPAIANAGSSGPDEMWTADVCGQRKWLVTPKGQALPVRR